MKYYTIFEVPLTTKQSLTACRWLQQEIQGLGTLGGHIDGQLESSQMMQHLSTSSPAAARHPGEWNWDGVWEDRVKKGIASSLSEPVLYGGTNTPDDLIKFLAMEDNDVDSVKENLRRTLGKAA
ncbi:hypothetical protein NM208_g15833 [Fusarium decemcellulare]|uniref:Uncharacterized protein n=1 Tax=Fusarium decemcellulare TaxID=57161 RepID=A0ACC1RBW5_9HYPO|nr:hypothetical protein NM208_g15833 [Fusarium decemcellulare]